ncbi:NAD(P)-dependent oxidoreductase [Nibricoccus sp. IMCC34717]|uniref:NAD(P)-dependent oxidoreductase n=1 Tax=Nibricoccus sp. IMCC34717 TaxID=3034021 RepID=UPI00384DFE87
MNLLVNLPPDFFTQPELTASFDRLRRHGTVRTTSHNTAEEIAADLAWADAVFMWSWPTLDEALLTRAGKIDFIGHIDVTQTGARCELARGIPVSLSRGGFSPSVSEFALGLILNALRRISTYHAEMREGREAWVKAFPKDINPLERQLTGASVALIGFGQVGRRLEELLRPFSVQLSIVDPFVPDEALRAVNARRCTLDEAIASSDVVVLCAASNAGTKHLIDTAQVTLFRPNSVFINVARAALVNTGALVARVKRGDLIACIDVFDQEPLPSDHPLRTLPNAHLTPHRAGGLISSVQRNIDWLIEDFEAHLAGNQRKYPLREQMIPGLDA